MNIKYVLIVLGITFIAGSEYLIYSENLPVELGQILAVMCLIIFASFIMFAEGKRSSEVQSQRKWMMIGIVIIILMLAFGLSLGIYDLPSWSTGVLL
ncbi:MAG: hypothetical protein AAB343_01880 [Patescibacteria group bacterium]